MGSHLYKSRLGKVAWFVRRFGAAELFLKPLRCAFAPLIIPRLARAEFVFEGKSLPLFYHRYNMTWANERAVEVPVAGEFLRRFAGKRVLEVGNVTPHSSTPATRFSTSSSAAPALSTRTSPASRRASGSI